MSVWVTRSAPDNLGTARRFHDIGLRPILFPALETRALPQQVVCQRPDAIVFSSIHAVRHHIAQRDFRDVPVVVRNGEIANAARMAGYVSITSTGDDEAMLAGLLDFVLPAGGRLVHYCADRTSTELERDLERGERQLERRHVYQSVRVSSERFAPLLRQLDSVKSISVHSSIAAAAVRAVIQETGWRGPLWCISERCADSFNGINGLQPEVAAAPTEPALVDMIRSRTGFSAILRKSKMPDLLEQRDAAANDNWIYL